MDYAGGSLVLSEPDLAPLKDAVAAFRAAADKVGSWSQEASSSSEAAGGVVTEPGGGGPSATAAAAAARAVALRGGGAAAAAAAVAAPDELEEVGSDGGGGGVGSAEATDWLGVADLNERLAMTERRFLVDEGLPGRQWFRHVLQAPGLYLG